MIVLFELIPPKTISKYPQSFPVNCSIKLVFVTEFTGWCSDRVILIQPKTISKYPQSFPVSRRVKLVFVQVVTVIGSIKTRKAQIKIVQHTQVSVRPTIPTTGSLSARGSCGYNYSFCLYYFSTMHK